MEDITTIEQSEQLIAAGVDPNLHDARWEKMVNGEWKPMVGQSVSIQMNSFSYREGYIKPAWTADALLKMLLTRADERVDLEWHHGSAELTYTRRDSSITTYGKNTIECMVKAVVERLKMSKSVTVGTVFYVKLGNPFNNENPLRVICRVDGVMEPGAICPEESVRYNGLFLLPNVSRNFPKDRFAFFGWCMPSSAVNKYTIVDGSFWDKANKMYHMMTMALKAKNLEPGFEEGAIPSEVTTYLSNMQELMESIETWIENNKQPSKAETKQ